MALYLPVEVLSLGAPLSTRNAEKMAMEKYNLSNIFLARDWSHTSRDAAKIGVYPMIFPKWYSPIFKICVLGLHI